MSQKKKNNFIPILTSEAGACLTLTNWHEIGVETVAYYFDELLMKPGFSLLNTLPDLRSYCGWQGTIVVNAARLKANSKGQYSFRSRFDGSIISIREEELLALLLKLQPEIVILPQQLAETHVIELSSKIPHIFRVGNEVKSAGRYLVYDKQIPWSDFMQQVRNNEGKTSYLAGEFDGLQLDELINEGIELIESDKPASDAFAGQVYTEQGTIALLESAMAEQHQVIDEKCTCPTCEQRLTRAYLHHLLMHTPLLCQRFLIQHNAHYYQHRIQSLL
ncbi:tRNA-guanine transglycosylase [Legionella drozanskii]|uniref:Queuine tRNA-ribosyltransferase n=1 Tax=Legionella drozanskii LLAP-1 TaxID=1212489 RepID=A0A0W0SWS0_9GAMM|nr:tRNA-guanine transglycosylase [Legionella drozanskii]KTC87802.1 queuine tRNA-ribosyltransferase [Legionella drozanskii LLAP-1]